MWGHYSARGQIDTGPVRAALAGLQWALHRIVGWESIYPLTRAKIAVENCHKEINQPVFFIKNDNEHTSSVGLLSRFLSQYQMLLDTECGSGNPLHFEDTYVKVLGYKYLVRIFTPCGAATSSKQRVSLITFSEV